MKAVARRNRPTTLRPINNRGLVLDWDRDEILFVVESAKVRELAEIEDTEFIVYHPKFKEPCIAYKKDWDTL